ncbi:MAG: methionyl-tRNA formyltransferase [Chitinophagaceae bacterium]
MEETKVILFCSSRFAFPVMHQLAYFNQLSAVIIPSHCQEMIDQTNELLKPANVPVITPGKEDLEEKAIEAIKKFSANTGLVLTFSYIIPYSVFSIPAKGFYNVHPGLLPSYRGADPMFYQIINREKFAGVTIHKLDEGTDTGEIVLQEKIILLSQDTYGMLSEKLAQVAGKLVTNLIKILSMGFTPPSKPQDESKAHYYKKQVMQEFAIDWHAMDAEQIIALIHACNPHNKGAAAKINNKIIRLLHVEKHNYDAGIVKPPGTIIALEDAYMDVSVLHDQLLRIKYLYMDEGFITPLYLKQVGFTEGMIFENIF